MYCVYLQAFKKNRFRNLVVVPGLETCPGIVFFGRKVSNAIRLTNACNRQSQCYPAECEGWLASFENELNRKATTFGVGEQGQPLRQLPIRQKSLAQELGTK